MKRYWVSWWSENTINAGCSRPPFQFWETGLRAKAGPDGTEAIWDDCSLCAMIDAESPEAIWASIAEHFPDYEQRFCNERPAGDRPGDRFRGWEGRTSLVGVPA